MTTLMRYTRNTAVPVAVLIAAAILAGARPSGETPSQARLARQATAASAQEDLDARIARFLEANRHAWRDMNVPLADGQQLHDVIVEHGYTRGLEIGTSTGHPGIWIARALAKTGGTPLTIETDPGRHRQACATRGGRVRPSSTYGRRRARVCRAWRGRSTSLHRPDKDWYTNYAKAVLPRSLRWCLTAHNVSAGRGRRRGGMTGDFYGYITTSPTERPSPRRLSISFKGRKACAEDSGRNNCARTPPGSRAS